MKKEYLLLGTLVIIAIILVASVMIFYPKTYNLNENDLNNNIINDGQSYKQLSYNGQSLRDDSVYISDQIIVANRSGFNAVIMPGTIQDIDGKDLEVEMYFGWNGGADQDIDLYLIFEGELEKGKVELRKEINKTRTDYVAGQRWVSNKLIDEVTANTNLGTPDERCELGNTNNTKMYEVTYNNGTAQDTKVICFTDQVVVDADTFRVSGNIDDQVPVQVDYTVTEYVNIGNKFQFLGNNLLGSGFSFYQAESATFKNNKEYKLRITFDAKDNARSGKWHVFAKWSSDNLVDAVNSGNYFYIDPWWDNDWANYKILTNITGDYEIINVTYEASMNATFSDLRFLDADELTELNYGFEKIYNGDHAIVRVKPNGNETIYMYYGNENAPITADMSATYGGNLTSLYNFDEASGSLLDIVGGINYSASGTPGYSQSGKIANSIEFIDAENDYFQIADVGTFDAPALTVLHWINFGGSNSTGLHGTWTTGTDVADTTKSYMQNGYWRCAGRAGGGAGYSVFESVNPSGWTHVGCKWSEDNQLVYNYRNGDEKGSAATNSGGAMQINDQYAAGKIATYYATGSDFEGRIDDYMVFHRDVSEAQIYEIYNTSTFTIVFGAQVSNDASPNVTLLNPADGYTKNVNNVIYFGANISDDQLIDNYTLYLWNLDGSLNDTDFYDVNQAYNLVNNSKIVQNGNYTWNYYAYDNASQLSMGINRSLNVNVTILPLAVAVMLNLPNNNLITSENYINFSSTITNQSGIKESIRLDLWDSNNNTYYSYQESYGTQFFMGSSTTELISPAEHGIVIHVLNETNLSKLGIDQGKITAGKVKDISGSTLYTSTDVSLDNFSVNMNYTLQANQKYILSLVYSESQTVKRNDTAKATFPLNVDNRFNILNTTINGVNSSSTRVYAPINIFFDRIKDDDNFNLTNIPDDDKYSWNILGCVQNATATICDYAPTNYSLTIDTTNPSITLYEPIGFLGEGVLGESLPVEYLITDANLDSCWYEYNNVNYTTTCNTNSTFTYDGTKTLTMWANDSAGNLNSVTTTFNFIFVTNNATGFNSSVYETSNQRFTLNLSINTTAYPTQTASLIYNGVSYTTTKTTSGSDTIFYSSIDVPAVGATTNYSLYWRIYLANNTDNNYFNSSTFNQTVNPFAIYECSTPFTNEVLNFTTYDSSGTVLNSSFEATFDYYLGSGTVTQDYNYTSSDATNHSQYVFCANVTNNIYYDLTSSYIATGYDRREYIVENGVMNTTYPQDIPLYLDTTENTDIVTITLTDQNYNRLAGYLVSIQEWNIGTNTYSNIGMFTTSSTGQGIINLELYNVWYRAVVSYGGDIIDVTDVQKLSSTDWNIIINLQEEDQYALFEGVSHGLTFDNNTGIVTFTFLDSDNVNQGCLVIQNHTSTGKQTLSNECVESESGTIVYSLTDNGTYTAYGILYLGSIYNYTDKMVDSLVIQIGQPTLNSVISSFGKVISLIAAGTMLVIGASLGSILISVGGFLLALFGLWKMGWLNLTTGIMWAIIMSLVVVLLNVKRRNT